MLGLQDLNLECCSKNAVLDNERIVSEENSPESTENIKTTTSDLEQPDILVFNHDICSKPAHTQCDVQYCQSPIFSSQNVFNQGSSAPNNSGTQNSETAVKLSTETINGSITTLVSSVSDCSESLTSTNSKTKISALKINEPQCPDSSAQSCRESLTTINSESVTQSTNQNVHGLSTQPVSSAAHVGESHTNKCDSLRPDSPVAPPIHFSDVIEFIQSGKPIPGILYVDAKPTNTPETPSAINRLKKPWE